MKEQFDCLSYDALFSIWRYEGKKLIGPAEAAWNQPGAVHPAKDVHVPWIETRASIAAMQSSQCMRLDIPILYDRKVVLYDEDELKGIAQTEDGERFIADVVIACDGVGTKSHRHVTGREFKATSSG